MRLSVWISVFPVADFNPRTPCGVRHFYGVVALRLDLFQSTHPLRGATSQKLPRRRGRWISIHAPLAGCDLEAYTCRCSIQISIHAPLAGCDCRRSLCPRRAGNFNPRTPCGVRPTRGAGRSTWKIFQSTHPLRGATAIIKCLSDCGTISIHAPLAGCDLALALIRALRRYFNPRTPCGVRRRLNILCSNPFSISIHAPLAGCDLPAKSRKNSAMNFNPRTPCGVRLIVACLFSIDL